MNPVTEEQMINPDFLQKLQSLISCKLDTQFYKDLISLLKPICPDMVFGITESQNDGNVMIRSFIGVENELKTILPIMGKEVVGLKFKEFKGGNKKDNFLNQELIKFDGDLYKLSNGKISQKISDQLFSLIELQNIYLINLSSHETRLGSLFFFTKDDSIEEKKEILETYGRLISDLIFLKKNNDTLIFENTRFNEIFENASQAISIHQNGNLVKINDSYAELFGYDKDELIGFPIINLVAPDYRNMVLNIVQKMYDGEKTLAKYETACITKDGREIDVMVTTSRFEIDKDVYSFAFLQDVTERNQIEKDLIESEEKLFETINATPDPINIKDPDGKWILANSSLLSLLELNVSNYIGKTDKELAEFSPILKRVYNSFIEQDEIAWIEKKITQNDVAIIYPNGDKKIFDVLTIPKFSNDGTPKLLITWGRNITERIESEDELKRYRNHLEDLVEERAAELIKTIESLSLEVSNRKKIENIIRIQNRIANELISSETIKEVIDKTFIGLKEINSNIDFCIVPIEKFCSQFSEKDLPDCHLVNINKDVNLEKIQKILGNSKQPIQDFSGKEFNEICELKDPDVNCSLFPMYYKSKLFAILLIVYKNDYQIPENNIKVINNITLQLESILAQFISRHEILESEKRWKTLYKNSPGGTILFDEDFNIKDVNDHFCELTEYTHSEIVGKNLSIVCKNVEDHFFKPIREDQINNISSEVVTKSGKIISVIKSIREIKIENEVCYLENFQNISELKSLQDRISVINQTFLNFTFDSIENINALTALVGRLFEGTAALYNCLEDNFLSSIGKWNTPDDYIAIDKPDGHICYDVILQEKDICLIRNLKETEYYKTDVNVKKYDLETYFGKAVYRNKKAVGSLCVVFQKDFIPTDDDVKIIGIIAGAIGAEEERRFINKELADYRAKLEEKVRVRTAEISFAHKRIQTEIEKHKETVELLKETEKEYQRLFENSHDAQILINFENREIIKVNKTASDLFDLHTESGSKKTLRDIFGPKSEALFYEETYKQTGNKVNFEINSNDEFFVDINASIVDSKEFKVILVSCRDITETKLAQKQLSESQRRYEELVQNANDIILRFDKEGRILYANPITEKNLGYSESELIGENVINFVDPDHKSNASKFYFNQNIKKIPNTYYELPILKKDGSVVWLGQNVQLIFKDNEIIGFQAVARNITQRKNAEYAMAESEKRFRTIAENINTVAIYGIGIDKKVIFWNSACENLYGYSGDQALGEDIAQLLYNKKQAELFEKDLKEILKNPDKPVEIEKELTHFDGKKISVLSNRVILKTSFGGTEIYFLEIDLTKRKETERQLQRAKKLAEDANRAKSSFLTNISHELRTPLNGILGYAQSLKDDPDLNLNQFEAVEIIERSGNHLLALIEDILDLSKIETKKLKLNQQEFNFIDFMKGIAGAIKIVAENKGLSFEFAMRGAIPEKIVGDEKHLGQVLYNLLGNAVKFTKKGVVKFRIETLDKKLRFTISDTGIGIPEKQMDEIFSPFIQGVSGTMKSQGTGLGLTISKRLVRMMGGNLKVNSAEGKGSEFYFDLKINGSDKTLFDNEPDKRKIVGYEHPKKLNILIVDDDYNNRSMLRKLLTPLGFLAKEAENGKEAIDFYKSQKFDLVLLDIMMPDIDGFQVAKQIIKHDKNANIIVISASSSEKTKNKVFRTGCVDFLSKPIKFKFLFESLEDHLHLKWIKEGGDKEDTESRKYEMDVPELITLNKIITLAKDGEITKLNNLISDIKVKNLYPEFTSQILVYSKEFQINEIVNFVKSFIE